MFHQRGLQILLPFTHPGVIFCPEYKKHNKPKIGVYEINADLGTKRFQIWPFRLALKWKNFENIFIWLLDTFMNFVNVVADYGPYSKTRSHHISISSKKCWIRGILYSYFRRRGSWRLGGNHKPPFWTNFVIFHIIIIIL